MDGRVKDGKIKEEDKRPCLKAGPKAKDSRMFFRDPVLKFCTATGSTPLQQSKFEGFGKRLGNLVSFPCAHDGSTPQQAPSVDVSQGCLNPVSICGSTPHSILTSTETKRLKAPASLRSETSLITGTAVEYKCVTGWQCLSTGSRGQSASQLDIPSCFESAESVQSRVSRVSAMLSPARHHTSVEHSSVAWCGACGLHCVVHVVVWTLWEEWMTFVGCACWRHMEVTCSIRVWNTVRDKLQSMCIKGLRKQSQRVRVLGLGLVTTRRFDASWG